MKVPDIFLPERSLAKIAEPLKHEKKKSVNSLKELVLDDFPEFVYSEKLGDLDNYLRLGVLNIAKGTFVDYGGLVVHIVRFKHKLDHHSVASVVDQFNQENTFGRDCYALLKDKYAIFIYTSKGEDCDLRDNLRGDYQKVFGFKEIKRKNENP